MSKPAMQLVDEPAGMILMKMVGGFALSQSLYVAARRGIADLLQGGPEGVEP